MINLLNRNISEINEVIDVLKKLENEINGVL